MKLAMPMLPPSIAQSARAAQARWQAMSLRERLMLAAVALAALAALYDAVVLQPVQRQRRALQQGIEAAESQALELAGRLGAGGSGADERLARAQQSLAQAEQQLAEIKGGITPPAQMAERLRTLLASARNLTVVAFRNLPALTAGGEPLGRAPGTAAASPNPGTAPNDGTGATAATPNAAPVAVAAPAAGGLYRHPIEIRLLGRYADIVAWLSRLESESADLHVTDVALELRPSGRIEARIGLYTLGTEPVWLTL